MFTIRSSDFIANIDQFHGPTCEQ